VLGYFTEERVCDECMRLLENGDEEALAAKRLSSHTKSKITFHAGHMIKLGGQRKSWKRRWFVLDQDKLSYYGTELTTPTEPLGCIDLLKITRLYLTNEIEGKNFCFAVETTEKNNRTFYFCTEDAKDLANWVCHHDYHYVENSLIFKEETSKSDLFGRNEKKNLLTCPAYSRC
jgi:superfamily II DNA helicase RecQ